jgi:RNA polymerase sigma-70 factor (ECF subfamily)
MVLRRSVATVSREPNALPDPAEGLDIADLVARAKAGDSDAYARLYRRYLDDVYLYAVTRLVDRDAAEDATQAIFVRAFASLAQCRENGAFPGWLFAIARSVVTDRFRARRYASAPLDWADMTLDDSPGPEDVALQKEAGQILHDAREACLHGRDRDLFDLLLTDLNDKEIAQALGRSHGAVRTAHYRLLLKLRECLAAAGFAGKAGLGDA